jgi:hypothetical protein
VTVTVATAAAKGGPPDEAPVRGGPDGSTRATLAERLRDWAERASAEHEAAVSAAAAYSARVGSGPAAAAEEFARLGVVQAIRDVERAARRVYGEPPSEWARYYPSPASPVQGLHSTEIALAAGAVSRSPAETSDPILGAVLGKERLVPRITLRASFEYGSGMLRVGHVVRPAGVLSREEFEDALLDQLHAAIETEQD